MLPLKDSIICNRVLFVMGRPFGGDNDDPAQLRDASVDVDSSDDGEESDQEDQTWDFAVEPEWQDPSDNGVLSEVLRAAEEGDSQALPALLNSLTVSVDTLVSIIMPYTRLLNRMLSQRRAGAGTL